MKIRTVDHRKARGLPARVADSAVFHHGSCSALLFSAHQRWFSLPCRRRRSPLPSRIHLVLRKMLRVMLTGSADWREVARAHGEVFGNVRPASTFVYVRGLLDPGWLVEIEADAVLA